MLGCILVQYGATLIIDIFMNGTKMFQKIGFFPVVAALLGNVCIAVMKFVGFFFTGSGALFSEAVHSVADTINQALLLVGIRLSARKADKQYSYGYGLDRFLWALISACGIFFLGAGVTIYHGVHALLFGGSLHIDPIAFWILGASFIIETITFLLALRELRSHSPEVGFREMLREGDPSTVAVLYEDGVAVLGVVVAFFSILLSLITHDPIWDAWGSIVIGALLAVIAVVLIQKNRSYLLRKTIPEGAKEHILEIMKADPAIEKVIDFKSSILDVNEYQIKCEVEFNGPALMGEIMGSSSIRDEYENVQNDYQEFLKFLVYSVGRVPRLMGNHIDDIEARIQEEIPEVKHIDIEIN